MKKLSHWLLPLLVLWLVGCSHSTVSQADYTSKLQTALTATDGWLKQPKDAKLLDQALADCQTVLQAYAETDFDKTQSMKDLKLLKLSLSLCKTVLDQGVNPDVAVEGVSSQSPADSVRQAKEMVEAELSKQKTPGVSGSPTPTISG